MNEGQLNRLLQFSNPWWKQSSWTHNDKDLLPLGNATLHYTPKPLEGIEPGSLYVLRGPRRVGKSTELKRAIASLIESGVSPRQIIYCSCDGLNTSDLRRLVLTGRDLATHGVIEPRYWFLDEVTAVENWPPEIKWLRDETDFRTDCVVLTGSSAYDLLAATKALAGRRGETTTSDRTLLPMCFRAFCQSIGLTEVPNLPLISPHNFLDSKTEKCVYELQPWINELINAWELYLTVGGFPRAVDDHLRTGQVSENFINALWNTVLGDAIRRGGHTAPQALRLLLRLSRSLTTPLNMTTLAEELDLGSHNTAKEWIKDLAAAYICWPCYQIGSHNLPKLNTQAKNYFVDPLISRLAHLRKHHTEPPDSSLLTEQQLGVELLRQNERQQPGSYIDFSTVMYMRTKTRKELDFVGPAMGQVPFEGKYKDSGWKRDAQTARAAFGQGVLATRSVIDTTGDVWALPAPFIAWLLNQ